MTFEQYLHAYEQRFDVNPRRPTQLQEYKDRTLSTTWNLTYSRLEIDDPLAARALEVLAYFDNQEIWFELLHAGLDDRSPDWLQKMAEEYVDFENVMGTLVEYCLLEAHPNQGSYSMHNCVHDWALARLKHNTNRQLSLYALDCVAASTDYNEDIGQLGFLRYARLARHGLQLTHHVFEGSLSAEELLSTKFKATLWVAGLLKEQQQWLAAEQMYARTVTLMKRAIGPEHKETLTAINNLGFIYWQQGKNVEAEQMYKQALAGEEKVLGPDNPLTLVTVINIGSLYTKQGRLIEAEHMLKRALSVHETARGLNDPATLERISSLGVLYSRQGKDVEAQQMHKQSLAGNERAFGPDHLTTLRAVYNIACIYARQGKFNEAEQMYQRVLAGREKALGADHIATLKVVRHLAHVYNAQGRSDDDEQMYKRALAGYEKALGLGHNSTREVAQDLVDLYYEVDKATEAEEIEGRYGLST